MPADIMRLWSLPLPPPASLHPYPNPLLHSLFAILLLHAFCLSTAGGVEGFSKNLVLFYILLALSKSKMQC